MTDIVRDRVHVSGGIAAAVAAALIAVLSLAPAAFASPGATRASPSSVKIGPAQMRPAASVKRPRGVVNINTASELELRLLPGIGPSKARRIVELREARGPFKRVRDLRRVKGIGKKTLRRLAPLLRLRGPSTLGESRTR